MSNFYYACDFSQRAVDYVTADVAYNSNKCSAFQCDLVEPASLSGSLTTVNTKAVQFIVIKFSNKIIFEELDE